MTAFTAEATAAGEARVREDLAAVLDAVRREAEGDALQAVYLLGGFAKGEGAVVAGADGSPRGFNDYDLLLVFDRPPGRRQRYAELAARLARELEIDFVDLGLATPTDLDRAAPTLFWYEFGAAHRELWRAPGAAVEVPRFEPGEIDREEGSRLLVNRGMAMVWAALKLWPGPEPGAGPVTGDSERLRFAVIAAHKGVAAAGDAALLRAGLYHPRQDERRERLRSRPELIAWAEAGFLEDYDRAARYRRRPAAAEPADAAALWWRARAHHEAGFAAAERHRLRADFGGWPEHRRLVAAAVRRRLVRPRSAVRAMKRRLGGGGWLAPEDRLLRELPELLYGSPAGGEASTVEAPRGTDPGTDASAPGSPWRGRAEAAVRRWHS